MIAVSNEDGELLTICIEESFKQAEYRQSSIHYPIHKYACLNKVYKPHNMGFWELKSISWHREHISMAMAA